MTARKFDTRPLPPSPWAVGEHAWGRRFQTVVGGEVLAVDAIDGDDERVTKTVARTTLRHVPIDVMRRAINLEQVLVEWLAGAGR